MPHVIVKLWPGKLEEQKAKLAEELATSDWRERVYEPDIEAKRDHVYNKPGYGPEDL